MTFFADRATGPACLRARRWTRDAEADVVATAIGHLVAMGYRGQDIHMEYTLGPGCRVDIAVILEDFVLLVECKSVKVTRANVAQADRYLAAARVRWPERRIVAVLTAPDVDERIVERDDLIVARI